MSQIISSTSSTPAVPTSFVTDINSPAVPIANVLNVLGGQVSTNNVNGIQTDGSSGSNTLTVQLTNRVSGQVTTADATPTTLISFALGATPAVYTFTGDITAFDATTPAGASYGIVSGIRTDGVTAIEIGTQFSTNFEEAALLNADIDVTVAGNSVVFEVTGVAATTIDWDGLFNYREVT